MSNYTKLITHREFIDMSNYDGAIPLRVPIEELLRGKVMNYVQRLVGDNPNATAYIGKIELLDENTNQILLGIGFRDPRNPKLPLVGRGLYIEHVHSDVYPDLAQHTLVGCIIAQVLRHCTDVMFVRVSNSIDMPRYTIISEADEHRLYMRSNTRTVRDYIPEEMQELTRVNARELLIAWGATDDQIHAITLNDNMRVLSDLQEIQDMLDNTFTNPINRSEFMTKVNHNPPFHGLTPIEYLTENPVRVIEIAQHIHTLGMPW